MRGISVKFHVTGEIHREAFYLILPLNPMHFLHGNGKNNAHHYILDFGFANKPYWDINKIIKTDYTRGDQTFFVRDLLKIYSTFEARLP